MATDEVKRKLTAILSADVKGYSRLMEADEEGTIRILRVCREVMFGAIQDHRGRVVGTAGDSVLAEFSSVVDALKCAVEIQKEIKDKNKGLPEDRRMEFRIGINLGDVVEEGADILGDGVNIAARVQGLAEAGGICITGTVHDQVKNKLPYGYEYIGIQNVKNIKEAVSLYRVLTTPGDKVSSAPSGTKAKPRQSKKTFLILGIALSIVLASVVIWLLYLRPTSLVEITSQEKTHLQLPDKPSIAVLPFDNLGGDPDQAYFADGMTEDLITDLSKVEGLFVIARNSTFVYRGKARDIREVAKALGVRYVLEGSVRRSGETVRVNAQLIDATTGGHVWADRYDGELKNIFALQDNVSQRVVAALQVELTKDDRERVARRGTKNTQAYDAFLKGWQHYLRQTPEDFRTAIIHFTQAVELDPKYGKAYAALAATYWEASTRFWDVALGFSRRYEARFQAEQFLAKAMRDPTPLANQVASAMFLHGRQHDEAIAEAKRAVAGDPNDADGYVALANVLSFMGRGSEAIEQVERATRLNPHYPPYYLYQRGLARFGMNRLDMAAASLEQALALNREDYWSQRLLLAIYGLLSRQADAAKLLETMKGKDKRGSVAVYDPLTIRAITYWYPFAVRADVERFAEGLRKAGVPD